MDRNELEQKLGQIAYQIGEKQEALRGLNDELQALNKTAYELSSEIRKLQSE